MVNNSLCPTGLWFKCLQGIKGCKDLPERYVSAAHNDVLGWRDYSSSVLTNGGMMWDGWGRNEEKSSRS